MADRELDAVQGLDAPPNFEEVALHWLNSLSNVTAAGSEPVTVERLSTMAALLAGDGMPVDVFCMESLRAVAGASRYFPAYAELRDALQSWWSRHRPILPRLAGDAAFRALSRDEQRWVEWWEARQSELAAPGYVPQRGSVDRDRASSLSFIREQCLPAFGYIQPRPAEALPAPDLAPQMLLAAPVETVVTSLVDYLVRDREDLGGREAMRAERAREVALVDHEYRLEG